MVRFCKSLTGSAVLLQKHEKCKQIKSAEEDLQRGSIPKETFGTKAALMHLKSLVYNNQKIKLISSNFKYTFNCLKCCALSLEVFDLYLT